MNHSFRWVCVAILTASPLAAYQPKLARALNGHVGDVCSIAWSPDGRTLASGSDDETIKIWDVGGGKVIRTFKSHPIDWELSWVESVAYSPDGRTLASASSDKLVRLWDVTSGKLTATLRGHHGSVKCVAWNPTGKLLASGSSDGTIRVWDEKTGACRATLSGNAGRLYSLAWSPDGKSLASGWSGRRIWLWDAARARSVVTLENDEGVFAVAFSPDGKMLASGGCTTVRLWDMAGLENFVPSANAATARPRIPEASNASGNTFKNLATLRGHATDCEGEVTPAITCVAFSPDGKTLASGSRDTTIKLWDVAGGRNLTTITEHSAAIACVAFSPDGRTLASASDDQTVRLWTVADVQKTEGR